MTTTPREAARRQATSLLIAGSFREFLREARVRSDDPLAPSVAPWQPWPHLVQRAHAWETGGSEVVLKARQLGYTWLLAAYLDFRARQGWSCAVVSKGQEEAKAVVARVHFIESNLPPWLRAEVAWRSEEATYASGGSIRAFPSTPAAGVSYTFQLVCFDEFAFHPYAQENYAAIRPTISAGGQMLIMSTADPTLGPSGAFHDMYWASRAGASGYAAHFEPWHARPGRDDTWLARERAAFVGLAEEFDAYYPDADTAAFVARSGLVFPQFSAARHVRLAPTPLSAAVRVVAGVDFGGGDPTAIVVLALDRQHHIHQYAEFYRRGAISLDEIGGFLKRYPVGVVVCDPSQAVAIETLRRTFGLPAVPANNKRGEGLGMVSFLLDHDRLTIDPGCTESIAEFPGYRWATKVDPNDRTRFATTTPVDHHADAMDARRYAVLELTAMLHEGRSMPTRTLSGRPITRKAV